MDAVIKAEWLGRLRSDLYKNKQAFDVLKESDGSFCVLGVLCDIYAQQCGVDWVDEDPFDITILGKSELLPKEIAEWAELDCNPEINGKKIVDLNDEEKLSFSQFADLIEEHL